MGDAWDVQDEEDHPALGVIEEAEVIGDDVGHLLELELEAAQQA
jgi:hypothetical protein